jgi:hypothetical protein
MFVFEKIRDGVTGCRFAAAQLQQRPCVAAVIDRHNDELMEIVSAAVAQVASLPLATAIRRVDLDLAAFVCVTSIEAVTHSAVLHHAEMLSSDGVAGLIDETTNLIVGHLAG